VCLGRKLVDLLEVMKTIENIEKVLGEMGETRLNP
jgi:hypothetical protein